VAISAATVDLDPRDTEDERDPTRRMLFDQCEAHPDITFRSSLPVVWGLQTTGGMVSIGECGARVLGGFARPTDA
jgi:hypothetical protein